MSACPVPAAEVARMLEIAALCDERAAHAKAMADVGELLRRICGERIAAIDTRLRALYQPSVSVEKLRAWAEPEMERLTKEAAHQRDLRSKHNNGSTWPEFHDGQAEGIRHTMLAAKRLCDEAGGVE